ncbi:TPA: glycosyltransferase [Klebsiella pneumoniae]|nr:glycosyltransferase [Klebsiella pneumoniae]HCM6410160.1 glycosyltransferase [Klebsiella pneumoniae]
MLNEPLVSVYMPTHNRSELLERAIKSVITQNYSNIELIICDDGSTDNTYEVVNNFIEQGYKIIYLRNASPRGACFSRNRCIEASTGQFVTGLDDDDFFTQNRISDFVTYLIKYDYEFMCTTYLIKNNAQLKKSRNTSGWLDFKTIRKRNSIDSQVFIKKEFIIEAGGFDESMPAWQDYDLWFRLLKKGLKCYKINNYSYIKDISHDKKRITTSSKAYDGYKKFLIKHDSDLSNGDKKSLYYCDLINRGEVINISSLFKVYSPTGLKAVLKGFINTIAKVFK